VPQANEILKEMKVELVSDGLSVQFVPDAKDLDECRQLGQRVAERLVAIVDS
jgi:flavorubredoxin